MRKGDRKGERGERERYRKSERDGGNEIDRGGERERARVLQCLNSEEKKTRREQSLLKHS